MTAKEARSNPRLRAFLTQLHSDAYMRGEVSPAVTEASLAEVLDCVMRAYDVNHPSGGMRLLQALSALADALDNPDAEIKLTVSFPKRPGARKSDAQHFAEAERNRKIAEAVWEGISAGKRRKQAVGLAAVKFKLGSASIYNAIKSHANHDRLDQEAECLMPSLYLDRKPAYRESTEFHQWLEAFAVSGVGKGE